MIAVVLCYDGWTSVSYIAGEIRNPQRNIPLSLGLGLAAIIAIYVLANFAYMRVLPVAVIASTDRTGAAVAESERGGAHFELPPAGTGAVSEDDAPPSGCCGWTGVPSGSA